MDLWASVAGRGWGTSVQGSRDEGTLDTGRQTWTAPPGLAASPGAPAALGRTHSFGTAGKAHLGREAGVTSWRPLNGQASPRDKPRPPSSPTTTEEI